MVTERDEELIEAAHAVQGVFKLSEPDRSAGSVAAALRTTSGSVYTGICIDVSCGIGFCAEHAAIAEMLRHRETGIDTIVAVKKSKILPPCGRCREFMVQVNPENGETRVILSDDRVATLRELLPERPYPPGRDDDESR